MESIINELTELANKCDKVSMHIMDNKAFEKYFAKIYGAVNHFHSQQRLPQQSVSVIKLAFQLLDSALQHHIRSDITATLDAVRVFESTTKLLLKLIRTDLRIDQRVFDDAQTTAMNIRALKAFGINPPGHNTHNLSSRFTERSDSDDTDDTEAVIYAKENITEFVQFVYHIAHEKTYVTDPFRTGESAQHLALYEQVKSLVSTQLSLTDDKA